MSAATNTRPWAREGARAGTQQSTTPRALAHVRADKKQKNGKACIEDIL